jgi:hypothetical protein
MSCRPFTWSRRHEPGEERWDGNDQAASEAPCWDFSSTGRLVGGGAAEAEQRCCLLDGDGQPVFQILETEGMGNLCHVETSM